MNPAAAALLYPFGPTAVCDDRSLSSISLDKVTFFAFFNCKSGLLLACHNSMLIFAINLQCFVIVLSLTIIR